MSKRATAIEFLRELTDYREQAKIDAKKLVASIPLSVISDQERLRDYLREIVIVISEKYLLSESGTVPAKLTSMIRAYVRGMR